MKGIRSMWNPTFVTNACALVPAVRVCVACQGTPP